MQIETIPLDSLREDPNNAREHGIENMASIKASLQRFGQRAPLVVRDGMVVAGNGRLRAMLELGWTEAATTSADDLTQEEARAFALADNRSGELAGWDDVKLMDGLRAAAQVEGLAEMMQIDMDKLKEVSQSVNVSAHSREVGGNGSTTSSSGDVMYSVIADFDSEEQQTEMLAELKEKGIVCRALVG